MATIVHFDISANDLSRAKTFYESLFGWSIKTMEGFPDYYEIETMDGNGKPAVGGGLTKRQDPTQTGITDFVGVESIDLCLEKLSSLGGKIMQPKQAIQGMDTSLFAPIQKIMSLAYSRTTKMPNKQRGS